MSRDPSRKPKSWPKKSTTDETTKLAAGVPNDTVTHPNEIAMAVDPAEPAFGFQSEGSEDIKINYKSIPNLPDKIRKALTKYDVDGNGEVSLSELLNMSKSRDQLKKQVCILVAMVLGLLAVLFFVSFGRHSCADYGSQQRFPDGSQL
jgi:hypothetical protein